MSAPEVLVPKVPERPGPKIFKLVPAPWIQCYICDYQIMGKDGKKERARAGVPKRKFKDHMQSVHGLVKRG